MSDFKNMSKILGWFYKLGGNCENCRFLCLIAHGYLMSCVYEYHHHHHHHHIVLVARISLTISRHSSLSFIALGRSSGQHPVSSHSCWMYVRAGRPAFARPCVGIHKSTSLMSSSLLLQQCPACLVRLTWIVFVIGGRWPYSWCLVGCCFQDLRGNEVWSRKSTWWHEYTYIYIYICVCSAIINQKKRNMINIDS